MHIYIQSHLVRKFRLNTDDKIKMMITKYEIVIKAN